MEIVYGLLLAVQIFFAVFIVYLCVAFITGGPFVPSTPKTVESMIKNAHIKPGDTIYDMGSGDGRLLFAAAALGAKAVGIEINPYLVVYTNIRAFFSPYRGKISAHWQDMWKTNLRPAHIVFVYLVPWRMEEFAAKLTRELKPGSIVVSNSFIFPDWKEIRRDPEHHVFTFKV